MKLYHWLQRNTIINYSLKNPVRKMNNEEYKTKKSHLTTGFFCFGAGGRTRTGTVSPPVDFESTTSANSITPAQYRVIISKFFS